MRLILLPIDQLDDYTNVSQAIIPESERYPISNFHSLEQIYVSFSEYENVGCLGRSHDYKIKKIKVSIKWFLYPYSKMYFLSSLKWPCVIAPGSADMF